MAEIVGLKGLPISDGRTPNSEVVELIEDLLEKARAGEITGVCVAVNYFDNSSGHRGAGTTSYAVIGRLEYLKAWALESLDDG